MNELKIKKPSFTTVLILALIIVILILVVVIPMSSKSDGKVVSSNKIDYVDFGVNSYDSGTIMSSLNSYNFYAERLSSANSSFVEFKNIIASELELYSNLADSYFCDGNAGYNGHFITVITGVWEDENIKKSSVIMYTDEKSVYPLIIYGEISTDSDVSDEEYKGTLDTFISSMIN